MAITGITTPTTFMNGYSAVPLRVLDTNATLIGGYKYLFNLLTDTLTVSSTSTYTYLSEIWTTLNFSTTHNYQLGDTVFLDDTDDTYTGYYIVRQIVSTTSVRIDLVPQTPFVGTFTLSKAIKYKMNPGPTGDARIDFGNTLKDYVTQDLQDVNEIYEGPNTRHSVRIRTGYESNTVFTFDDNYFYSGKIGFIDNSMTSVSDTSIKVGDEIRIQQNLFVVQYSKVFAYTNANGETKLMLTLTTSNASNFERGPFTILIEGQVSYPSNNGYTTINTDYQGYTNAIFTNMDTNISAGTEVFEGGYIYANISPEYDVVTKVIDVVLEPGGVVVVTDINYSFNTPAIGGTINSTSLRTTSVWDGPVYDVNVFNSYVNQQNYSLTDMNDYVMFDTTSVGGPSTILSRTSNNRIEQSTKSYLLFHNTTTPLCDGVRFWWYNSSGSALGVTYVLNTTSNLDDFYCPVGIDQIIACVNKSGADPSTFLSNISYYKVQGIKNAQVGTKTALGKEVIFELSDDCSRYDMLHLMWKDAKGSWLSYPFRYIHTNSTEVSRSNYYQNAWNWDNSSFGYDSYSKGDSSYFVRGRDKLTLNSGWVTESENELIRDLLLSASVYLQDTDGTLKSCIIQNNELTLGSKQNDDIWQYKLDIKLSNDEIRL